MIQHLLAATCRIVSVMIVANTHDVVEVLD